MGDKIKSIQVPFEFFALSQLLLWGLEEFKFDEDIEGYKIRLQALIDAKMDSIHRRNLYTGYKTASSEDEKEKLRLEYLNAIGMRDSFRWK